MIAQAIILAVFAGLVIFLVWAVFGGGEAEKEYYYRNPVTGKTQKVPKRWSKYLDAYNARVVVDPDTGEVIGVHFGRRIDINKKRKRKQ